MKIWSTMKIEGRFTAEIDVPDTNPETIKKGHGHGVCGGRLRRTVGYRRICS